MSIEQTDAIDFVSIDDESGNVLLTISDHLDWNEDEGRHLVLLQGKLNSYLRFIESGEILEEFPNVKGRNVIINLVGQFPLSEKAKIFLERAGGAISGAGFSLKFKLFRSN